MIELLSIRKEDDFDRLIDFIHDQWFDLEHVSFNRIKSSLEIPFVKELFDERQIIDGSLIKKIKIPVVNCLLKIFEVDETVILDTQRVGSYDMTWIEYNPELRLLQISTGVPLDFKIFIREIKIKIYKDEIPLSYKHMRILGI